MKGKSIRKLLAVTLTAALITAMPGSSLDTAFADDLAVSSNITDSISSSEIMPSVSEDEAITTDSLSENTVSDNIPADTSETGSVSGVITADGTTVTGSGSAYNSSTADQNTACACNSGTLILDNDTLTKSGDGSNADSCNFYGTNSISLTSGSGSTTYIADSSLSASSSGSNGIFAYNSGTVYANNDTISTAAANSRGLDATYSGKIIANLLDIDTAAEHCGGLATDREGGYISVANSQIDTKGSGSPVIYSTGTIETDNVTGKASGAQAVGMEGLNNVRIYNSTLEGSDAKASEPYYNGIMLYQSMSGDSKSGTADFEVYNSTIRSSIDDGTSSAAMFYVTNTTANVVLKDTLLDFNPNKALLIAALGNNCNSWGTAGSNGGLLTLTAIGETLKGNILTDTISYVNLYLTSGTSYSGKTTINTNSVNTRTTSSPITMNIDSTSEWIVTGNSTVTALNAATGARIVDLSGNTVTIKQGSTTRVSGSSPYTVTVTGTYTDGASVSGKSLSDVSVSRSAFDSYYKTSTAFNSNGSSKNTTLLYDEAISPDSSSDDSGSGDSGSGGNTTVSDSDADDGTDTSAETYSVSVSDIASVTYTGSAIKPLPVVTYGSKTLTRGTDYTLSYSHNRNVSSGSACVLISGRGSFAGTSIKKTFDITAKDISDDDMTVTDAVYKKTGSSESSIIKAISAVYGSTVLKNGTDYTLEMPDAGYNTAGGTFTATMTGCGNYTGSVSITLNIEDSANDPRTALSKAAVTGITSMTYTGLAVTESPELTCNGAVLTEGTDYTVTYMNNVNVGRATVIFAGKGDYRGSIRKYFRITAAALSESGTEISAADGTADISAVYVKGGAKPAVLVKYNNTALTQGTDYTVRYTNNRKTAAAADEKAPTVTVTGKGNYRGTLAKTFSITASSLSSLNAVADDVVYRNKAGNFINKITITDSDGKKLTAGTDYSKTFSYAAGGTALQSTQTASSGSTVVMTASGLGAYAGTTVSASYRLTPAKNFSSAKVTVARKNYTGSAVRLSAADITVKVNGTALNLVTSSSSDGYKIVSGSYVNNSSAGTASVILRGCGSYSGIKKVKFKIYPVSQ